MPFNYTIETFQDFISLVNQQTFGFFGIGFEVVLFLIIFQRLSVRYNFKEALFFSLLLLFPITPLFVLLNLMPKGASLFHLMLLALSVVFLYITSKE